MVKGLWGRVWARWRVYLLPVVVVLCLTVPHLDQGDVRRDTARYAAVGLSAWQRGDLADLRMHPDQPYWKKPPLAMVIHGGVLWAAGVGEAADFTGDGRRALVLSRLPSVAAACGCVAGLVWLVRGMHTRAVALTAGLVLALTVEFFRRTREVSLDLWQVMFMLLAAGCAVRGVRRALAAVEVDERGAVRRFRGLAWWAAAGVATGLSLLVKPLVGVGGLVVVGAWGLVAAVWSGGRHGRVGRSVGRVVAGGGAALGMALAVAGPWHLWMWARHGGAFVAEYFGGEVAARAAGRIGGEPWWYYGAELTRAYWPWLAVVGLGAVWAVRGRLGGRRTRVAGPTAGSGTGIGGGALAWGWLVAWLAALSAFGGKAPQYAVVLYPAGAWVCGLVLAATPTFAGGRRIARRALVPAVAVLAVGSAVFAALPVRVQRGPEAGWAELFAALGERAGRGEPIDVVAVGVDSNELGRFVLRGLPWPRAVSEGEAASSPAGTLVLRMVEERPAGQGEAVVSHVGRVRLSVRAGVGAAPTDDGARRAGAAFLAE